MEFDDNAGPPPNHFTTYVVEGSAEEVLDELAIFAASLIDNGFQNPVGTPLGPRYYLLDKTNFISMLGQIGAPTLWQFPIPSQFQATGTPRDGWTDEAGVKRKPPPSEDPSAKAGKAGGGIKIDFLANIVLLYAQLVAAEPVAPTKALATELLEFIRIVNSKGSLTAAQDVQFQALMDKIKKVLKISG